MEKQTKNKPKMETVNVTKIYETIKDKGFIQDLWLDIMSDMKEKPSYKHLKGMVEKVIESSVENYNTKPKDPEERLKTRTIFTDLSIMTYTIDTLISELLYKKLKDEFKSIISNIVDELKTKPKSLVAEDNQADDVGMLEDIGKIICNGKEDNMHLKNEVSDDDDGNCSFRSVSSVHTSDLSSFEDDVSISSEDEYGVKIKKRVSLKLATDLYAQGRISDLHEISRGGKSRKYSTEMVVPEKSSVESPNKRLSGRMRKPNSKYASDDMVCPIKLLLPQTESYEEVHTNFKNCESQKEEKVVSHEQKGKRGRPPKVIPNNEEISSRISSSSEDSLVNLEDRIEVDPCSSSTLKPNSSNQTIKQVKRGRPPKNKSIQEDDKLKEHKNEIQAIKKRGRPPKIVSVVSLSGQEQPHSFAESIDFADPKAHSKQSKEETSLETQWKNSLTNTETELKRKRGRPTIESNAKKVCEDPIEHSVESFSQFEERLCLKDQKTSSPSKNSTKSYSSSDLYKPRSDFRVSFNSSRESKALTLFSN